jgi:2-desacetyl-2-hydroxyethyl bacteriochlorophyllide A dehydrogenase
MHSQRLIFPEPHRVVWHEEDLPDPGPGEVLIRTHKTLISAGTEMTAYTGDFPANSVWSKWIRYPFREVGYSNVGEIVAVGPDVSGFEVGQRVASWGGHATANIQALEGVYAGVQAIPDRVSDDQAVFWQLGKTVMNGVRLATIALGEAVVVVGVGVVGQLAVQYASLCGAYPLIAVDLSAQRLALAQAHGATHTLVGGRDEIVGEIRAITRGRMADVVFEVTGSPRVIPTTLRMARRQGRIIILGSPRGKVEIDFHDEVHTLGLHIIGAQVSTHPRVATPYNPWTAERNGELFFDLVMNNRLHVDDLITHRFDRQDAWAAYQMLAEDRTENMGMVLEGW